VLLTLAVPAGWWPLTDGGVQVLPDDFGRSGAAADR
jgi:hypothetical protein